MKQKITLLGIMLVVSIFVFGQNDVKKRFGAKFNSELKSKDGAIRMARISNFKNNQKPVLKSATAKKQQLDYGIGRNWNSEKALWEDDYKFELTYDAKGNWVGYISSEINSLTGQFEKNEIGEYAYDANGNPTVFISRNGWNSTTGQWENSYKTEYNYDANGNLTVENGSNWNSETNLWQNSYKTEYIYDANGKLTVELGLYWDSLTSLWETSNKTEYIYDANGKLTIEFYWFWSSFTSLFEIYYKTEYSYDANGKLTEEIRNNWKNDISQWVFDNKQEYSYDANGNTAFNFYSRWNNTTSLWESDDKEEHTYDLTTNYSDLIAPSKEFLFGNDYSIVNKPVDEIYYDYENGNWVNDEKLTYYYSDITATSLQDLGADKYSVYPTPALDVVNVSFQSNNNVANFELYDTQGRKLITKPIGNNEQISLEGLNSGLYIYHLNIDGAIKIGKLIKE